MGFIDQGLMGLYDQPRQGALRSIIDDQIAQMIQKVLINRPLLAIFGREHYVNLTNLLKLMKLDGCQQLSLNTRTSQ